ncbi:MAG: HAMP domain-containing protein [Anaerolineae bacterium]|nr:HAMP domain-containing protein [Anaerolineae bacterium]
MVGLSLRVKLVVVFLVLTLAAISSMAILSSEAVTAALKNDVGANLNNLARSDALATGDLLARQVDALIALSVNQALRERALNESDSYEGDQVAIIDTLLLLNQQWYAAHDDDPLVQSALSSPTALALLDFQGVFPEFAEVIFADRYGGLIATTDRTTDYYQADEAWWQAAYHEGQGSIYVGQPIFDESTALLGVEIAVPVYAEHTPTVLGVLKVTYELTHLSYLLTTGESHLRDLRIYILLADNRLWNSDKNTPMPVSSDVLAQLRATVDHTYTEMVLFGKPSLVSQMKVRSITATQFIDDLNWYVVVFQDRQAALSLVTTTQRLMFGLAVVTIIGAVVVALLSAQFLTRPIRRLTATVQEVRQGNFSVRASIETRDEIGQLAAAFNEMTSQLAISIDALEQEIAERKRTEEELTHYRNHLEHLVEQRTAELRAANEQLISLSHMKDEFVSNVTHELRTPITNLKLRQYLLEKQPDHIHRHLPVLRRETERLEQIIENLLQLSRLDQARVQFIREPVDLNTLAEQYVADRMIMAKEKPLSLSFQAVPNLPTVIADEALLGQVLSILLTNAINYTSAGGQVTVRTHLDRNAEYPYVGFSVRDTGPGISPIEQTRLFSRFFRGQAGRETGVPGTGLGLAIAKEIVGQHGGRIEVESEGVPGRGTVFTVWIPRRLDEA